VPPGRIISKAWRIVSGPSHHLDRVVGAALAAQLPYLRRRIAAAARQHHLGGAQPQGALQLAGVAVDRDHAGRPGQPGTRDRLQADAAAADHGDALAGPYARHVAHRAQAGDDAAADQRRLPQGQPGRELDRGGGGDDAALGEAGDAQEVLDGLAAGEG
jgi:hypothetical protein